jgi:hypothetical protein
LRLEDQILRDSRHAGGIVITDKPVTHYMPTQIGADEKSVVTAFADRVEFPIISDYGFLKNDILGVKGLPSRRSPVSSSPRTTMRSSSPTSCRRCAIPGLPIRKSSTASCMA